MHITSTTNISDIISKLRELEGNIEQSSWIPVEDMLGLLVAGTLVCHTIFEKTDKSMMTEEEVDFILNIHSLIEDELGHIETELEADDEYYSDNG